MPELFFDPLKVSFAWNLDQSACYPHSVFGLFNFKRVTNAATGSIKCYHADILAHRVDTYRPPTLYWEWSRDFCSDKLLIACCVRLHTNDVCTWAQVHKCAIRGWHEANIKHLLYCIYFLFAQQHPSTIPESSGNGAWASYECRYCLWEISMYILCMGF